MKSKVFKNSNGLGYTEKPVREYSKWFFTETILCREEGDFQIQIELVKTAVAFWIFAMKRKAEHTIGNGFEDKMRRLQFRRLLYGGFYSSLLRRKLNEHSLRKMESDLKSAVRLLTEYHYKA